MKHKKTTTDEAHQVINVENKVYNILHHSVTLLNNRFPLLRQKLSPKVSVLQVLLDIYPEKKMRRDILRTTDSLTHICVSMHKLRLLTRNMIVRIQSSPSLNKRRLP